VLTGLLTRWMGLVADGPNPEAAAADAAEAAGRDLLARYAEPQRRYHDQRHLAEVLDAVDALAAHAADPRAVALAAWFHDAVYQPAAPPGRNEEDSALLAEQVLPALGLDAGSGGTVAAVAALVRGTAHHEIRTDDPSAPPVADAEVLYDADLAILAAAPERYAEYTAGVRAEYAHVPDEVFRPARAAILRGFVDRPRIYRTPTAYTLWEMAARANLATELADLSAGG
jgi:predicted metal-dependent HD superfamily phosphohydrolase